MTDDPEQLRQIREAEARRLAAVAERQAEDRFRAAERDAQQERQRQGNDEDHHDDDAPIADADFEAEIVRLAKLPATKYERQRQTSARMLGLPVGRLDRLIRIERGDGADPQGQGRPLDLPPPVPWPDPVEGATLLRALADYFADHLVLSKHAEHALALWTLHCYCFDAFAITPRLQLKSAVKGAGKSTVFDLLKLVTPKAIEVETVSAAFLFRAIELVRPTVLLDEADRYLKAKDNDELVAMINAGAKQGGTAGRCVGEDQEPRVFSCHAPVALAGIGTLPGTIEDRSIVIAMKRRLRDEPIQPIDDTTRQTAERLQRQCARWTVDHAGALRDARPDMGTLINRAADRWAPLYGIADAAGGDWPQLARDTQFALAAEDDDADSLGERLLHDIREAFNNWIAEHSGTLQHEMTSAELVKRLLDMEGRPWAELPGRNPRPLTANKLARLLRPFGVGPCQVGPERERVKGYRLLDFEDAFTRHLGEGG